MLANSLQMLGGKSGEVKVTASGVYFVEVVVLKKLWIFFGIAVVLCLSACDNLGHPNLSFPAQITSIDGFEGSEKTEVSDRVAKLIETVGTKFLLLNAEGGTGSTVQISMVDEITKTSETSAANVDFTTVVLPPGRGVSNKSRIAGRATRYGNECHIQISRFVLEYGDELLQPVLWHEIGHCAGLQHDPIPDKLMSAVTYPLSHYTESDIAEFIKILLAAIS